MLIFLRKINPAVVVPVYINSENAFMSIFLRKIDLAVVVPAYTIWENAFA
jgi:hypothetical protein